MVTVAPNGYTGEADYYCTGVDDQIQINAAIIYLSEAYGGGEVQLLEGNFEIEDSILMNYSNIRLEGVGHSSILRVTSINYYPIYSNSTIANISIGNLCIDNTYGDQSPIRISNAVGIIIQNIKVINPTIEGISIGSSCSDSKILNNIITGENITYTGQMGGISCYGTLNNIIGNTIKNIRNTSSVHCIRCNNSNSIISNNNIYDISTSSNISDAIGISIYGDYCEISNNRIEQCKNTGAGVAYGKGIWINTGKISNKIMSNYCYNNGLDTGIANTNGDNFYDLGTDTQVYSNSWQSPVSGQASYGELHPATVQTSFLINGYLATTVVASCDVSAIVPVGANSVDMLTIGQGDYSYFMTSKNSGCTCTTNWTNMRYYIRQPSGSFDSAVLNIPIDSNRKFYFRSWDNAAACGSADAALYSIVNGYRS